MFSMAAASIFLPFLPLLAKQILLNNFLSDIPAIGIAGDNVDPEFVRRPHRWNIRSIRNFMILFGLISSIFDFVTFGLLLWVVNASVDEFRTGWFIESLLTELVIALVVRTRRRFYRSRPGKVLLVSTVLVALLTIVIPYLPGVQVLGFTPLPAGLMAMIVTITLVYVVATETVKGMFHRRFAI
jgi:Mg2+-importing ATPase